MNVKEIGTTSRGISSTSSSSRGLTRRDLVKGGAGFAAAVGLGSLFAACGGDDEEAATPAAPPPATSEPAAATSEAAPAAEKFTGTLNVLGLGVDLIDPIAEAAEKDLGFTLEFQVTDTVTMEQIALTQPDAFDVFSGYHYQYDRLWPSGNLQPIDRTKITLWDQVNPLFKLGKVDPASTTCVVGQGDAPVTEAVRRSRRERHLDGLAEHPDRERGPARAVAIRPRGEPDRGAGDEPQWVTGVPAELQHGLDGVQHRRHPAKEPNELSWAELLNPGGQGPRRAHRRPGRSRSRTPASPPRRSA